MVFDNDCSTKLGLSIGSMEKIELNDQIKTKTSQRSDPDYYHRMLLPSLTLGLCTDDVIINPDQEAKKHHDKKAVLSVMSGVSSFSDGSSSMKREREISLEREDEDEDENEEEEGPKKKLRLSKEQSIVLEGSFREHNTLNFRQKQILANMLSLKPRQVEVWFQNRRARRKLKQTEIDSVILKKYCESLTEENKRLHKELQYLKSTKVKPLFHMQRRPTTTDNPCPSCQRFGGSGYDHSHISFSNIGANPRFYNPFTIPSAACW